MKTVKLGQFCTYFFQACSPRAMKHGRLVRRVNCNKGSGNLTERPIFKRLKQDEENLTPDDG
jgi:hypothetical protein